MCEEWRSIFDGDYIVSNYGRVASLRYVVLKPNYAVKGYARVRIHGKRYLVHRLVGEAFIPNPEGKPQINHIDMDKKNNHVDNLEWVTALENNQHAAQMRRNERQREIRKASGAIRRE